MTPDNSDPVLAQRQRIRLLSNTAQRVGYTLYLLAMVAFFVGMATSYSSPVVSTILVGLIGGSIILAIAIQVGYAIRGAERHEEDSIAQRRRR